MCGRFVSTSKPEDLVQLFGVTRWNPEEVLEPDWNVSPTDPVWAVLERPVRDEGPAPVRQLRALRWGLVPSWAKDPSVGSRMINARAETVHEKPAFRKAFTSRRCLLPADGFYEWVAVPATTAAKARKQPYFITPQDGGPMAMAGLYEFWRNPEAPEEDPAAWLTTCSIITTDATDAAGRIHPRMPLTITPADTDAWLDPAHGDPTALRALLVSPGAGRLTVRPVSSAVNSVRNNGPHLLDEAPQA
ncbi:putative SOS response-associated peptidase YedK [Kitasatospora sp. MAP12-15]|uniref:SOS response-associated peptidase n=1 Tax=unclassified Kitasatospora TaxID=2633591 RepID=UPI002473D810|nr:SOS response-associated peptidase [Kitasatospora sp. MAP12-44]